MKCSKTLALATLLLITFAPPLFAQSAGISGERCYARITRSKQPITLNPNQVGHFPQLDVRPQSPIKIEVIYPNAANGAPVDLQVMDGGALGNGQIIQRVMLDSSKKASFTFTTNGGRGMYRVMVGKGADNKMLEFWVGDKLPIATE